MAETVKRPLLVADAVCERAGGFGDLEPWVRQTLDLFPIPSADLAAPLFTALLRICKAVPWLEEALGSPVIDRLAEVLGRLTPTGTATRSVAQKKLVGPYALAGTMVGSESTPMPGPDSLRASLWVCHTRWTKAGTQRSSTIEDLAAAIRGAVKNRSKQATDVHPIAKHLATIGKTRSLEELIAATKIFHTSEHRGIREAWKHVDPELSGVPKGKSEARPQPVGKPPPALGLNEDEEAEVLIGGVRRIPNGPPDERAQLVPSEPPAELSTTSMVTPVFGRASNPDARRMAELKARQVVWNQNALLLTNHPDVLPEVILKRVLQILVNDLPATTDLGLRVGMAGLLLQAVTGRTTRSLGAIRVVEGFDHAPSGHCELSLATGAFRLRVFFAHEGDSSNGYFRPTEEQARRLESVDQTFLLPLPVVVVDALRHSDALATLAGTPARSLDGWIRVAAQHVGGKVGLPLTAGQVRRSLSVHLFESCRDTALTQLICADTLGQSEAPLHYYAPRTKDVAQVYQRVLSTLFESPQSDLDIVSSDARIGSSLLVRHEVARAMAASLGAALHTGVDRLVSGNQIHRIHEAMVTHLGCMLMASATHRPVDALFQLNLDAIDLDSGAALFQDKIHDPAHDPRLVVLPSCVIRQMKAYLAHLAGLMKELPDLAPTIRKVMAGKAPLLFGLNEAGSRVPLTIASFTASLPAEWRALPLNWGRTWVRTRAVESGLRPELVSIQLGHLEAVGYPFSNASPTTPAAFVAAARSVLDRVAVEQGWVVRHGIESMEAPLLSLPPLRAWSSQVNRHEQVAKDYAKTWHANQRAGMQHYRRQAENDVLAHEAIIRAGIDVLYADANGPWKKHSMTKDVAETLRDAMFEDAGANTALGLARAKALHRILKKVNKRVGMQGQEPAPLLALRRPLDNAFVPGLMLAVRQVCALRQATLERTTESPGDWRDFALACARVAHALAVFGHCDDPTQIEGALHHRERLIGSATLDDAILVPWGDRSEQVLGLRGLAALALARLAKKYPSQPVPSRAEINCALAKLLPKWAAPLSDAPSGSVSHVKDLLALLCETVAVSNRFELSPAARMAMKSVGGSVCAHPMEQIALLDADPVGSLKRDWEMPANAENHGTPINAGNRTGNARTQYLALCRAVPTTGNDLYLPLTGQTIGAGQLSLAGTRAKVIAEVKSQLAAEAPNKMLQPIVRLLARWLLQMLEEGTPAKNNPADSTVGTYLTRIGGGLVEIFGNASLSEVDDVALEDAYLDVVEGMRTSRDKAAAAILEFHDCGMRHFGLPELDLSEVRAYLASDIRTVDASLVLPAERDAAITQLTERSTQLGARDAMEREQARVDRQATAAMPLYGYGGARRSEILGLKFRDVSIGDDGTLSARIRANRSRRLKTQAARRTLHLSESIPRETVDQCRAWVLADRSRLPTWRVENAYVFSPLEDGRLATGRSSIADACLRALGDVTGRPHERLHRLRHLVAFELITPLFLSHGDRAALSGALPERSFAPPGVVLPRDLMAQVITLGHAHWSTTIRCYYHLPWLLRSHSDADLYTRYCNRRGAAAVMGLTLPAVDRITQQAKGLEPASAWLNHVKAPRAVPARTANRPTIATNTHKVWTATELGRLLKLVEGTKDLQRALTVMGGDPCDAIRIRKAFLPFEKRLGRRLLGGERMTSMDMPRHVVRDIAPASGLESWWTVFDGAQNGEGMHLRHLARHVFEWMDSDDGDVIKLESELADTLVAFLAQAKLPASAIERLDLDLGFQAVRVVRTTRISMSPALKEHAPPDRPSSETRYLGLAIKRVLGVIWAADRLRHTDSH